MRSPSDQFVRWREHPAHAGTLHVICGCMFAGKTELLLDEIAVAGAGPVQVFKPGIDDRYHRTRVVSHSGRSASAVVVDAPAEILDRCLRDGGLTAIDECHFFDGSFANVCETLVGRGLHVVAAGLDRDSWGRPFPQMELLRSLADVVTVMQADCARCDLPATRTQRLTPIINGRIVGGAEAFEPRCPQCWTPPPGSPDQITRLPSNTGPCVQQSS